jgi:integrase/recombinase XerD
MNKRSRDPQLSLFDLPQAPVPPRVAPATSLSPSPFLAPLPLPTPATSLAAASAAFDEHLGRLAKTDNTRRAFGSDLRVLAGFLGEGKAVGAIDTAELNRFLSWMLEYRDADCSPKTYARRLTTLKVFFGWLKDSGALARDPAAALPHKRVQAPLPRVLTDREVMRALELADLLRGEPSRDPRPAFLLRLLLDAGLKKGELARLRTADLNLDADPPSLLVRYDQPRFARKERRVPVGPAVARLFPEYLLRYRIAEDLFPWTARNLEYVLADVVKAAALGDDVSFETFRWTSALRAWRAGVDPTAIREALGLSPITWVETEKRLADLAPGLGPSGLARWFSSPGG